MNFYHFKSKNKK